MPKTKLSQTDIGVSQEQFRGVNSKKNKRRLPAQGVINEDGGKGKKPAVQMMTSRLVRRRHVSAILLHLLLVQMRTDKEGQGFTHALL